MKALNFESLMILSRIHVGLQVFGASNDSGNLSLGSIKTFPVSCVTDVRNLSLSFALALKGSKCIQTQSIFHARIVHTFVHVNTTSIFWSFRWFFQFQIIAQIRQRGVSIWKIKGFYAAIFQPS